MALNYRALVIPTAAIDSAGRAKPNAVFSVTPVAGGSPVAVYGAAQGGSALAADQIKTDALGNISGLYVDEPGPYTLSFAGGGTVVTSAVMDSRDVATPGDLADALGGASPAVPAYSYDPNTGAWTVTPGRNPGCARITAYAGPVQEAQYIPFAQTFSIPNPEVATLTGGAVHVAEAGLYLVNLNLSLQSWNGTTGDIDPLVTCGVEGITGPNIIFTHLPAEYGENTAQAATCLIGPADPLHISGFGTSFQWGFQVELTIIRLD